MICAPFPSYLNLEHRINHMDQDKNTDTTPQITSLGKKSWTAYVRATLAGIVLCLVVTPIMWAGGHPIAGIAVLVASLAFVVYRYLYLKSFHLYFDDSGVWIYSGVFPWDRGSYGMNWRDIEGAVFQKSMRSWLFKSYSISVRHRFDKSGVINFEHCSRGHEAVMAINERHDELIKANAIN